MEHLAAQLDDGDLHRDLSAENRAENPVTRDAREDVVSTVHRSTVDLVRQLHQDERVEHQRVVHGGGVARHARCGVDEVEVIRGSGEIPSIPRLRVDRSSRAGDVEDGVAEPHEGSHRRELVPSLSGDVPAHSVRHDGLVGGYRRLGKEVFAGVIRRQRQTRERIHHEVQPQHLHRGQRGLAHA